MLAGVRFAVRHAKGVHVDRENAFLLLALGPALAARGDELAQGLDVKADALGFQVLVADIGLQG